LDHSRRIRINANWRILEVDGARMLATLDHRARASIILHIAATRTPSDELKAAR